MSKTFSFIAAILLLATASTSFAQAVTRGEVSPGTYVNIGATAGGAWKYEKGPEGTAVGAKVALTNASAQSGAITGSWVDVICDVNCFILIAASPTAIADTSYLLIANTTYRFPITTGNKVAGILSSGTGNLWWHAVK